MSAGLELGAIADGGHQGRRGDDADTWDGRQALACLLGAMPGLQFSFKCPDSLLHCLKLGDEDAQGFAGKRWEPWIIRVFNQHNSVIDP